MLNGKSQIYLHEKLGRFSISMTYFCLLFALAFALTVDKDKLRHVFQLYSDYPVAGVSFAFVIAAITFFAVYAVSVYTKRDLEQSRSTRSTKKPIVYTERNLD
jgi:FtsH-binding integral membrane protein